MTAIKSITKAKIKGFLEGFIEGLVAEYQGRNIQKPVNAKEYLERTSSTGELKPFHAAIIPADLLRINAFERGFSTRLGNTFEECARLIALDHHQSAYRSYDLTATVSRAAIAEVDFQVEQFEHAAANRQIKPSFQQMKAKVLSANQNNNLCSLTVRADLYILTHQDQEYFFEMKSPKPNKDQCHKIIQRLLRFHLLQQGDEHTETYYAMPYNPYGFHRESYKHSFALNYFPFQEVLKIGHEFWDLMGGEGTQEELLNIYLEVGKEKGKFMIENLAFNF